MQVAGGWQALEVVTSSILGFVATWLLAGVVSARKACEGGGKHERVASSAQVPQTSDYKQVFVVRKDVPPPKRTKASVATLCATASILAYDLTLERFPAHVHAWQTIGEKKIAVACPDEATLRDIERQVMKTEGICGRGIVAGDEEGGGMLVYAIGPAPSHLVSRITGHLKLL